MFWIIKSGEPVKKKYYLLIIVSILLVILIIMSPYKNYKPLLEKIVDPVREEIVSYIKNNKHHPSREEVHRFLTKYGCKVSDHPDKNPYLKQCKSNGKLFIVEIFYDIDHSFNSKKGSYNVILHIVENRELGLMNGGYRMTFITSTLDKYTGGEATDIPVSFESKSGFYWNTNQYIAKLWSFIPRMAGH